MSTQMSKEIAEKVVKEQVGFDGMVEKLAATIDLSVKMAKFLAEIYAVCDKYGVDYEKFMETTVLKKAKK